VQPRGMGQRVGFGDACNFPGTGAELPGGGALLGNYKKHRYVFGTAGEDEKGRDGGAAPKCRCRSGGLGGAGPIQAKQPIREVGPLDRAGGSAPPSFWDIFAQGATVGPIQGVSRGTHGKAVQGHCRRGRRGRHVFAAGDRGTGGGKFSGGAKRLKVHRREKAQKKRGAKTGGLGRGFPLGRAPAGAGRGGGKPRLRGVTRADRFDLRGFSSGWLAAKFQGGAGGPGVAYPVFLGQLRFRKGFYGFDRGGGAGVTMGGRGARRAGGWGGVEQRS